MKKQGVPASPDSSVFTVGSGNNIINLNAADIDVDLQRTLLTEYAERLVRPLITDAYITHSLSDPLEPIIKQTGMLYIVSITCGEFTCCYEEPTCFFEPASVGHSVLWRFIGGSLLREAKKLKLLASDAACPPEFERAPDDLGLLTMLDSVKRYNEQQLQIAQLNATVEALKKGHETLQKHLLELSDGVCVCQTRMNILQFGEDGHDEAKVAEPVPLVPPAEKRVFPMANLKRLRDAEPPNAKTDEKAAKKPRAAEPEKVSVSSESSSSDSSDSSSDSSSSE